MGNTGGVYFELVSFNILEGVGWVGEGGGGEGVGWGGGGGR